MKEILHRLINQEILDKQEAKNILISISKGDCNESQIAAFLTVYMMRSITIEELAGFREALLELCISVDFSAYNTIDLCGTGGDGKNTFNISTLASFITAGANVKVAKHGNYGVSSISGSSNVMENLGICLSNNIQFLTQSLEEANIAILHAPHFHPAMKKVAETRTNLAVKTFFNMLGPMVNPSFPQNQLIGVYSLELARMYSYLYQNTTVNYCIIHGLGGFDEISLTDDAKIISPSTENIINASFFNVPSLQLSEIQGGTTTQESATIFYNILTGNGTEAQKNVVQANAAMAISLSKKIEISEAFQIAKESLESGKALQKFKILQNLSSKL